MADLVDHPTRPDLWRHDPPMWEPCTVCGGPTCWVELDIAFQHPECEMYPSEEGDVRVVLGVKEVARWLIQQPDAEWWSTTELSIAHMATTARTIH